MYTHCRGWIEVKYGAINEEGFDETMEEAEKLSPRAIFCISSTTFNVGSNGIPYIFIGGELKNYDDDWDIFLNFLFKTFDVVEHNIETRYEEDDFWNKFDAVYTEGEVKA